MRELGNIWGPPLKTPSPLPSPCVPNPSSLSQERSRDGSHLRVLGCHRLPDIPRSPLSPCQDGTDYTTLDSPLNLPHMPAYPVLSTPVAPQDGVGHLASPPPLVFFFSHLSCPFFLKMVPFHQSGSHFVFIPTPPSVSHCACPSPITSMGMCVSEPPPFPGTSLSGRRSHPPSLQLHLIHQWLHPWEPSYFLFPLYQDWKWSSWQPEGCHFGVKSLSPSGTSWFPEAICYSQKCPFLLGGGKQLLRL